MNKTNEPVVNKTFTTEQRDEIELCVVCGGTGFQEDICDGVPVELFCECSEGVKRMDKFKKAYQREENHES